MTMNMRSLLVVLSKRDCRVGRLAPDCLTLWVGGGDFRGVECGEDECGEEDLPLESPHVGMGRIAVVSRGGDIPTEVGVGSTEEELRAGKT